MTVIPERLAALDTLHLDKAAHPDFAAGHCVMEVAAYLAGEPHTDQPQCVAVPLRKLMIGLNDQWDDEQRQRLRPFVPRVIGTAGDGRDEARSMLALDWLIRTYTPAWLDLAGLSVEAQSLRDLRRIVDLSAATGAGPVVHTAQTRAAAAWDAAWAAAGDAAGDVARDAAWAVAWDAAGAAARAATWDAAWDAARDAAGDAARAAAGAAARAAAWDAARAAAWDAARDAARAAAWDAARAAAWDAARDAAGAAAGAAAWDAAGAALASTVDTLQASALELLEAMINPAAPADS